MRLHTYRTVRFAAGLVATLALNLGVASVASAQLQPGYAIFGKDPETQTTDTFIHVDIGLAYLTATSEWDLHVHVDPPVPGFDPSGEYEPDDALLYITENARVNNVTNLPFLGIGATPSSIYLIPQSNPQSSGFPTPNMLWLGIGAEENSPSDFNGNITLFLRDVRGYQGAPKPGDFAVWQQPAVGAANVFMASFGGITNDDQLTATAGAHDHYNFAFTNPGIYEVTFEAVGTPVNGGPTSSGLVTYYFGVGTTTLPSVGVATPEPGVFGLLALGLTAGAVARRKRK